MVYDVAHLVKWHPWQHHGNREKKRTVVNHTALQFSMLGWGFESLQ
jgi:hypothetical protein